MHNLLLASLVYWLNSDFYLLKMLCREYFTVNSYHENSNEFSSVTMVNFSFLLKEIISEWVLLKPLVVVRTTHTVEEFENPKWNNELIWTECPLWGGRCSWTPSRWLLLLTKLWYVFGTEANLCFCFFVGGGFLFVFVFVFVFNLMR